MARRLGYQENRTPFLWFDEYASFDLEIRLDREAILLAPLEVVARQRARSIVLAGFRHRSERGLGWYFDREEIERLRPSRVTDLLRHVPGVNLVSSGSGMQRVASVGRARGRNCSAQVFIDGMLVNGGIGQETGGVPIDNYVSPASLEGVEVYRGSSTVPAEFLNDGSPCGVIVLWTRRGGE